MLAMADAGHRTGDGQQTAGERSAAPYRWRSTATAAASTVSRWGLNQLAAIKRLACSWSVPAAARAIETLPNPAPEQPACTQVARFFRRHAAKLPALPARQAAALPLRKHEYSPGQSWMKGKSSAISARPPARQRLSSVAQPAQTSIPCSTVRQITAGCVLRSRSVSAPGLRCDINLPDVKHRPSANQCPGAELRFTICGILRCHSGELSGISI